MTTLPPGLHPTDRRGSASDWTAPAPAPQPSSLTQGRPTFATPNSRAMGVYQRASRTWSGRALKVGGTPVKIVGRKKGRLSISVWVPKTVIVSGVVVTVTHGVLLSPSAGEASQYAGVVLNVGDSITVPSEASAYAIALPGQTSGYLQYLDTYNPTIMSPGT